MSTKCYLLILFATVISLQCFADELWFDSESIALYDFADSSYTYAQKASINQAIMLNSNSQLGYGDEFNFVNKDKAMRNQHVQNNFYLSYDHQLEKVASKVEYRNSIFGSSKRLALYSGIDSSIEYWKRQLHSLVLSSDFEHELMSSRIYGIGRMLVYSPVKTVFDANWMPIDSLMENDVNTDIYIGATYTVNVLKPFFLNVGIDYKDNLDETKDIYDLLMPSAGVSFKNKMSIVETDAECSWLYRDTKSIPDSLKNMIISKIRAVFHIHPQISAFITFNNIGCYDNKNEELLLVSNYLREHIQYRFSYDQSNASYVLIGGKYSPQNKANAYFSEVDFLTINRIYLGGNFNIQPDRQKEYSTKVTYFFTPWNEAHISFTQRDNSFSHYKYNYYSLGMKLVF